MTTTYTNTGVVSSVSGASTYLQSAAYDWDGQVTQQTLGSGTNRARLTANYENTAGRLQKTQVHTEHPGTPNTWDEVVTEQYRWFDAGDLKSIVEQHNAATTSVQCFTYDYLRRLTEAWTNSAWNCGQAPSAVANRGPDPYWTTWAFDTIGNRTSQVAHSTSGGANATTTYTHPASGPTSVRPHALSSYSGASGGTYAYDDSGNTTTRNVGGTAQTLTLDAEGKLTTHVVNGQTSTYLYDADGARLIRTDPAGKTLYLPGHEVRRAGGVTTATRYYPNAVRTNSGLKWLAGDHHGTRQTSIDTSTLTVSRRLTMPYGEPRGAQPSWPDDHGYLDAPTDPTGLTHLGAREYDPTVGRFISVDPLLDLNDPQQMNAFAYAGNNPTSNDDASGMIGGPSGGAQCGPDGIYCGAGGAPTKAGVQANPSIGLPGAKPPTFKCITMCSLLGIVGNPIVRDTTNRNFSIPVHNVQLYMLLAVEVGKRRGVDPRLLLGMIILEAIRDQKSYRALWALQAYLDKGKPSAGTEGLFYFLRSVDTDKPSIGITNVKEDVFTARQDEGEFINRSWTDLIWDDRLAVEVVAARLVATMKIMRENGNSSPWNDAFAAAAEHGTGLDPWRPGGLGRFDTENQSRVVLHMSRLYAEYALADTLICRSGVWEC